MVTPEERDRLERSKATLDDIVRRAEAAHDLPTADAASLASEEISMLLDMTRDETTDRGHD
ncbi:MAG: hypothetical protein ABEJ67_03685 [Halanaeroarchaeum sp.]